MLINIARRAIWFGRRYSTALSRPAFAFDIDGVLKKGSTILPQARRALRLLEEEKVPFVLLTNGGGTKEIDRAKLLSSQLGVSISPEKLIQSHTPMQALVPKLQDKSVLVIGGADRKCHDVAIDYGFKNVFLPDDFVKENQSISPFRKVSEIEVMEARNISVPRIIETVLVFDDSRDWGRDLQIMIDALTTRNGQLKTFQTERQDVPIYFSNPDLLWSNEYPLPRFGQGALQIALKALYTEMTGRELEYTCFGKPHKETFEYAHNRLRLQDSDVDMNVYMVGDNPAADIAGANAYGWKSILVRTGVFQGGDNDKNFPARHVVDDVWAAVQLALRQ